MIKKTPQEYHTLIIGAGIAGLNTARFLESDTLIIDKKSDIGYPVQCGEGISMAALNREQIPIQSQWVQSHINHIKRIMPNGKHMGSKHTQPYALVIDKSGFEKYLASTIPWEIRMNTHVVKITRQDPYWTIETKSGDTVKARYLVGADGPNSFVARTVFNLNQNLVPGINYAVEFEKEIPANELQMFFGSRIAPFGYGWFFPTSKTTANVGLTQKTKGKIKTAFLSFMDTIIKPRYGNHYFSTNKSGAIPVDGFTAENAINNAFLIGDAGGFCDPIFEGGMNMALFTGHLAAATINQEDPRVFKNAILDLPFTGKDLVTARTLFYGLGDDTLNALGDVIHDKSTSFLNTPDGQNAFKASPILLSHQTEIFEFARIWQASKAYLW